MKKHFLIVACLMACIGASAQISTGEPNSTVIPRTGNRPQKGNWGLYVGGSVSQVMDLVDYINSEGIEGAYGLPVINLKYYYTDNWEFRMGFQFSARTNKNKTITPNESMSGKVIGEDISTRYNGSNYTRLLPGVAYHFSPKNLLDVYMGAQLPIGWNSNTTKTTINDNVTKRHTGAFVIGAGLFVGLQFFIADLPIAIGVEGGYSGHIVAEGVPSYKVETASSVQKYKQGTGTVSANWGADAAITFSYYFQ